jgi:hypothetical protein
MSTPQTAASCSVKRCKQIGVHTKQKKSKKKNTRRNENLRRPV